MRKTIFVCIVLCMTCLVSGCKHPGIATDSAGEPITDTIDFVVTDAAGESIEGVVITAVSSGHSTQTDKNGLAALPYAITIQEARWIAVEKNGYVSCHVTEVGSRKKPIRIKLYRK